jgi:hypothetical protein
MASGEKKELSNEWKVHWDLKVNGGKFNYDRMKRVVMLNVNYCLQIYQ